MATAMLALFAVTSLSGCLGGEELFTPRTEAAQAKEPGIVRLWFATNLADLPDEFVHVNVTLAYAAVRTGLQSDELESMIPVERTVDLLAMRREQAATQIGQIVLDEGAYIGPAYTIGAAEVVIRKVIGNRDGEPVYRLERYDMGIGGTMSQLEARHTVFSGMVTDLYVEWDLKKAVQVKSAGAYRFEGHVDRVSVYLNNVKVIDYDQTGKAAKAEQRRLYGDRIPNQKAAPTRIRDPIARIDATDEYGRDLSTWRGPQGYIRRAIGLGETITFDGGRSSAHPGVLFEEMRWEFGDGTRAFGLKAEKSFERGGIYDVVMTVRDEYDGIDTAVMTIFVPYTADEARLVRTQQMAGRIVPGSSTTTFDGTEIDGSLTFNWNQTEEVWNLGAYRITVETRMTGDDGGLGDQAVQVRLNATSGQLDHGVEGTGRLEIVTAGIPTFRGAGRDWVGADLLVDLEVVRGGPVDFEITVEALYFEPMLLGRDSHGGHVHGAWSWMDPDTSHIDHEGRAVDPYEESRDPEEPEEGPVAP